MDDAGKLVNVRADEYKDLLHGYAMTTHCSQGVTCDRGYVYANENVSGQDWIYVAASRSRDETTLYAEDELRRELTQTMGRENKKMMSTDYELD